MKTQASTDYGDDGNETNNAESDDSTDTCGGGSYAAGLNPTHGAAGIHPPPLWCTR
jgi:hypothetical protein